VGTESHLVQFMVANNRKAPLSIQSILEAQKEQKNEASKPKFLSKAERQAQALAKREAEVAAQKEKDEEAKRKREELENRLNHSSQSQRFVGYGGSSGVGGHRARNFEGVPTGPSASRGNQNRMTSNDPSTSFEGVPTGPKALRRDGPNQPPPNQKPQPPRKEPMLDYGQPNGKADKDGDVEMEMTNPPAPPDTAPPVPPTTEPPLPPPTDGPPPPPTANAPPPPPPPTNSAPRPPSPPEPEPEPEDEDDRVDWTQPMLPGEGAGNVPINQALLMHRYLGAKVGGRRKVSIASLSLSSLTTRLQHQIRKMSDKKFVFAWDKSEDTGADEIDPIYSTTFSSSSGTRTQGKSQNGRLFGGGTLGGYDKEAKREVPKKYAFFSFFEFICFIILFSAPVGPKAMQSSIVAGPRPLAELKTQRKGKSSEDDRHWSEKSLSEM
jgi:ATP-dependent RNA helicase DDX23/PRP28